MKFLRNTVKYYLIIAMIPALALYFTTTITLINTAIMYVIIVVVLVIVASLIQLLFNIGSRNK